MVTILLVVLGLVLVGSGGDLLGVLDEDLLVGVVVLDFASS